MKITEMTKEFAEAVVASGSMSHQLLEELFNTHPTVNVFFITVDGQAFFTEEMADSHGQKLKPREFVEITREDIMDDIFEVDDVNDIIPPVIEPPVIPAPVVVEPPVIELPVVVEPPVITPPAVDAAKPKKVTTPTEGDQV